MQKDYVKVLLATTPETNISEIERQLEQTIGMDCHLFKCTDLTSCIERIRTADLRFDIVLLDLTLIGDRESEKFLYEIQQAIHDTPVIVFLREEDRELALFMAHEGASIIKNPQHYKLESNRLRDLIEYSWITHKSTQATTAKHASALESEKDKNTEALKKEQKAGADRLREKDQIISWMSGGYSSEKDKEN